MLRIQHEDAAATPTQAYAHARWVENPAISPSWWREMLGHTVGKIALDWRARTATPAPLGQGCNLILTSPATHAQTLALVAATPHPQAFLTALVAEHPTPDLLAAHPATFCLWQTPAGLSPHAQQQTLTLLEQAAKQNLIEAYGLSDADLALPDTPYPLHQWLEAAAAAAQTAHGRRKRPGLRLLLADIDLLDPSLLATANTRHHGETVSPLELASRLGLATLAVMPAHPAHTPPPAAALAALAAFAEAEQALAQTLGGWPVLAGQPLFSVGAALARGQAPWPTPAHAAHWWRHLHPLTAHHLAQIAQTAPAAPPLVARWDTAGAALAPHAAILANANAQTLLAQRISGLRPRLPAAWAQLPAATLACAFISSLPGLAALAEDAPQNIEILQQIGDLPDPSILFPQIA